MQIDLIKEIVSGIIGKPGEAVIDILYKKKNVNEFLISKKLSLTINQTRNILYKLSDRGLVGFVRKKDSKKGGWYTYFWTLNTKRSLELLNEKMQDKIRELEENLERRRNERFYISPGSGIEYTEEEALEHNFICPETGEVLSLKDNKTRIEEIEIAIAKLKITREDTAREIEDFDLKHKKDIDKKIKIEQKTKEAEKKAKREKTKREKAKNLKKEIAEGKKSKLKKVALYKKSKLKKEPQKKASKKPLKIKQKAKKK